MSCGECAAGFVLSLSPPPPSLLLHVKHTDVVVSASIRSSVESLDFSGSLSLIHSVLTLIFYNLIFNEKLWIGLWTCHFEFC